MLGRNVAEVILHYANFSIAPVEPVDDHPEPVGLSTQARFEAVARLATDDGDVPRGWRITDYQIEVAREALLSGASITEAGRVAGMAWSTVRRLLEKEIASADRPVVTIGMTVAEVVEAERMRLQGWTYAQIGQRFGVSRQAVTKRLGRLRAHS